MECQWIIRKPVLRKVENPGVGQPDCALSEETQHTNFEEVDSYTFEVSGKTLVLTNEWTEDEEATIEILSLSPNKAKIKVTDLAYGYGSYPLQLTKVK